MISDDDWLYLRFSPIPIKLLKEVLQNRGNLRGESLLAEFLEPLNTAFYPQ